MREAGVGYDIDNRFYENIKKYFDEGKRVIFLSDKDLEFFQVRPSITIQRGTWEPFCIRDCFRKLILDLREGAMFRD